MVRALAERLGLSLHVIVNDSNNWQVSWPTMEHLMDDITFVPALSYRDPKAASTG